MEKWTCGMCKLNGSCRTQKEIARRANITNISEILACNILLEEVKNNGHPDTILNEMEFK